MRDFASALLILVLGTGTTTAQNGHDLFQKALLEERVEGNLEEAIQLYLRIAQEFAGHRPLASKALLQMAQCYEKLGKQEARKIYRRVLQEYPDQTEVLALAQEGLARLTTAPQQLARTMTVRELMRSGEFSYDKISDPTIGGTELTISSDGKTFVYTDWMTGDLVVKNLSTGKTYALYDVNWFKSEEYFEAPVLSPDEKSIAYLNFSWANNQDVARIETDSIQGGNRETVYTDKSAVNMIPNDWSPDGNNILVTLESADRSISLATLSTKEKKMQRLVTLNWEYPKRAQYSADGRFIAYDSTKDGDRKIYLISADGLEERVLIDSPGEDDQPLWSRDGRFLLFRSNASGSWDLLALPVKDSHPAGNPLLIKRNIGEAAFLRSITSDGKLFYNEQVRGPNIVLRPRPDTSETRGHLKALPKIYTRTQHGVRFGPDGKRLIYIAGPRYSYAGGTQSLRITNLNGDVIKALPPAPEIRWIWSASFSPDGKKIAVVGNDARRQTKVFVLSADTGTVLKQFSPVDRGSLSRRSHDWSRDGRLFYIVAYNEELHELFLVAIDIDSEDINLSPLPKVSNDAGSYAARVSPDEKYLFVAVDIRSSGQEIKTQYVLRSMRGGSEKVLKTDGPIHQVVWDHDSRHVFYKKQKDADNLYRLSIETGLEEVFWKDCKDLRIADVSPDGKLLAFETEEIDWRIWVVENFLPQAKETLAHR